MHWASNRFKIICIVSVLLVVILSAVQIYRSLHEPADAACTAEAYQLDETRFGGTARAIGQATCQSTLND